MQSGSGADPRHSTTLSAVRLPTPDTIGPGEFSSADAVARRARWRRRSLWWSCSTVVVGVLGAVALGELDAALPGCIPSGGARFTLTAWVVYALALLSLVGASQAGASWRKRARPPGAERTVMVAWLAGFVALFALSYLVWPVGLLYAVPLAIVIAPWVVPWSVRPALAGITLCTSMAIVGLWLVVLVIYYAGPPAAYCVN